MGGFAVVYRRQRDDGTKEYGFAGPRRLNGMSSETLMEVLDNADRDGWVVVATGDFDGNARDEILLRHPWRSSGPSNG